MKSWLWLFVLVVSLSLCSGAAMAKDKRTDKPKAAAGQEFENLDKNGDGKLTQDEFVDGQRNKANAEARWKKLAGGKDSLTLEEYKSALKKQAKRAEKK